MKRVISVFLVSLFISLTITSTKAASIVLSSQSLMVNGESIDCEKYNIDGSNYFKLRDLAFLLNGTSSQFNVGYDKDSNRITITIGQSYEPNGSELVFNGEDKSSSAVQSSQSIFIVHRYDSYFSNISAYNIGGNNYFKLRELGDALGFEVDYVASTNTAIINSRHTSNFEEYGTVFSAKYFQIVLPASWEGKYVCETSDDSIRICEKISYEGYANGTSEFGDGSVFTLSIRDYQSFMDLYEFFSEHCAVGTINIDGIDYYLCVTYPLDVHYDLSSETAVENYMKMLENMPFVLETVTAINGASFSQNWEYPSSIFVYDEANILNYMSRGKLNQLASTASNKNECGIYIVTVTNRTIHRFASESDIYSTYFDLNLGFGVDPSGIMLILNTEERYFTVLPNGTKANFVFFTTEARNELNASFLDELKTDDWESAFMNFIEKCEEMLSR